MKKELLELCKEFSELQKRLFKLAEAELTEECWHCECEHPHIVNRAKEPWCDGCGKPIKLTDHCTCPDPDVITARNEEHGEYCSRCGKAVKPQPKQIEELEEAHYLSGITLLNGENYNASITHIVSEYSRIVNKLNELIKLLESKGVV